MGWRGTVRSINAAYRAAERDSKRRYRELQRLEKEYAKMQLLEQAAYDVATYENHLERFLSIHKECGSSVDWLEVKSEAEPKKPSPSAVLESAAKKKEADYRPSFIDRIFGLEKKKRTQLGLSVQRAIIQDRETDKKAELEWKNAYDEWASDIALAERVLNGDFQAKLEAIKQLNPFSELAELGSELTFRINESGILECELLAHGSKVIPNEVKSLLTSGKLSVKKMPITRFNELFQDYICGCVIRISNELFNILPEDMVVITVVDTILNTATGHLEKQPILSAAIPRATISTLNLQTIDPSDSMRNFVHHMDFKKASGFSAVARVDLNFKREELLSN